MYAAAVVRIRVLYGNKPITSQHNSIIICCSMGVPTSNTLSLGPSDYYNFMDARKWTPHKHKRTSTLLFSRIVTMGIETMDDSTWGQTNVDSNENSGCRCLFVKFAEEPTSVWVIAGAS